MIALLSAVVCVSLASAVLAQGARGVRTAPGASGAYSWTGFYAGVNAGYGFGGNNSVDLAPVSNSFVPVFAAGGVGSPDSLNPSGFVGGVQVGYNYQFNRLWVGGVEADIQYADLHDSQTATAQGSGGLLPKKQASING